MTPLKKLRDYLDTPLDNGFYDEQALEKLLIREPEGIHLVYVDKLPQSKEEKQAFAAHAAALANACGGFILVGARWNPAQYKPELPGLGIGSPDEDKKQLEELIATHIEPPIDALTTVVRLSGGKHILAVQVPSSLNAPHRTNGVYPQRAGRDQRLMTPDELGRWQKLREDDRRRLRERALIATAEHQKGKALLSRLFDKIGGVFLYVASIPAVLSGRPVGLRLPQTDASFFLDGESLPVWISSQSIYTFPGGGKAPTKFAFGNDEGDVLFAMLDPTVFQAGDDPYAFDAGKLEAFVAETLRANLPVLRSIGYSEPFYAALVVKPRRGSSSTATASSDPQNQPPANVVRVGPSPLADGIVPLAFLRQPPAEPSTLPLVQRLHELANQTP